MLKLLYKLFPQSFNTLFFEIQNSKKKGLEDFEFAFIDSSGKKWYKVSEDVKMPYDRFVKLQEFLVELGACMTHDEFVLFKRAMKEALNETKPNIAMIGWLTQELEAREKFLIHEEIMYKILNTIFVREDQDPYLWDEEIENQKVTQLRKDAAQMKGFFLCAIMKKYVPYIEKLGTDWKGYSEELNIKVKAMNEILTMYTSGQGSLTSEKIKPNN